MIKTIKNFPLSDGVMAFKMKLVKTLKYLCFQLSVLCIVLFILQASTPFSDTKSFALANIQSPIDSYTNPAALSLTPQTKFSSCYENYFLIKELSNITLAYQQPCKWIDFSLLFNYEGCDLLNEIYGGINVSKVLKSNFSLGLRLYYYRLSYLENEHVKHVISGDIGMQYIPVDNFKLGVLILNPYRASFSENQEEYYMPFTILLGCEISLSESASLYFETEKDLYNPFVFKGGIQYQVVPFLGLLAGISSSPFIPSLGVNLHLASINILIASTYHIHLGFSPAVGLSYIIK